MRTLAWLWTLTLLALRRLLLLRALLGLAGGLGLVLLLARLHLIFLTLLRLTLRVLPLLSLATLRGLSILSRRAAGRTLALGGGAGIASAAFCADAMAIPANSAAVLTKSLLLIGGPPLCTAHF